MEPLQLSFSVAALLGEKLSGRSEKPERERTEEDAGARLVLPPTPQPSDSEEDEPPRKRRCVEQCELAKVNSGWPYRQIGKADKQTDGLSNASLFRAVSPFVFSSRRNRPERRESDVAI